MSDDPIQALLASLSLPPQEEPHAIPPTVDDSGLVTLRDSRGQPVAYMGEATYHAFAKHLEAQGHEAKPLVRTGS